MTSPRARAAAGAVALWGAVSVLWIGRVLPSPDWPGPQLLDLPIAFVLARTMLWSVLPLLLARRPLPFVCAAVVALDAVWFAAADAFAAWEAFGLALAVVPGQIFFRMTRDQTHLRVRVLFHFVCHAVLLVWALPAVVMDALGGSFAALTGMSWLDKMALQLVALPGVLAIAAMTEFLEKGNGTPMPHDAPTTLVTSGPFAFVANPLQIMKVSFLLSWGLFLGSVPVMACGVAVFLYGVTLATWNENRELPERFGDAWREYRSHVRCWWPRLEPWYDPREPPARFRFDGDCNQCRQLARWLAPAAHLELVSSGTGALRAMTYERGGKRVEGVAALARAMEHKSLGWAFLGWSMRLPFVEPLLQLITNVVTGNREPEPCRLTRAA